MMLSRLAMIAAFAGVAFPSVGAASSGVISIAVGHSGLTFSPNTVFADVGDILEFSFYPSNHSVAQGAWDQGCEPVADGGFFSGFVPVEDGQNLTTFRVIVNSTDPAVFYCTTGTHCQDGMYGVVNPASGDSDTNGKFNSSYTLAAYAALAMNATDSVSPPALFGGVLDVNATSANAAGSGNGTTNGTVSAPHIPTIPNLSSDSAVVAGCIRAVLAVAMAACLV